jgi:uncharacterized membrane protein
VDSGLKPLQVWIAIVLLHAGQTTYYYPRLPALVAQHFDAAGRANGWASRDFFFAFSWMMLLGISAIFMLTPRMLRRVPVSMINLPNKDYWLAPERKDESMRFLEREMQWMGVLTVAFILLVLHLAIRANLDPGHRFESGPFLILLVLFLVATCWWIVRLYRRFPKPGART